MLRSSSVATSRVRPDALYCAASIFMGTSLTPEGVRASNPRPLIAEDSTRLAETRALIDC